MFQLNYRDGKPIYEQIQEQLRKLIVSGAIRPDEKLPSIRDIASSLSINPNTIGRAYRELEIEGYIYTIAGKGSFVASKDDIDKNRQQDLLVQFDAVSHELFYLGCTTDSLMDRLHLLSTSTTTSSMDNIPSQKKEGNSI